MNKPYTFEYKPVKPVASWQGDWQSKGQTYKTPGFAKRAAQRWADDMAAEGCPVDVRVRVLVLDGRGGAVAQEYKA